MSAREVALLTLGAVERQAAFANVFLKKAIAKAKLDRRDAALATRLVFGTLQNRILLDYYLGSFSSMKLSKMEHKVRDALRLGAYQLLFLNKIPQNAAVNESVELCKRHCKNPRAPGMVNGILRTLARNLDALPAIDSTDETESASIRYSHPKWLVEELRSYLPAGEWEALLGFNQTEAPTYAQCNCLRADVQTLQALLEEDGVSVVPHPWLAGCLELLESGNIEQLRAFAQGLFYIQNPAAHLAVFAAGIAPGARVLDLCAAPGGKSFAAAIAMQDQGSVLSCDLYPHKKQLIEAGAARLGLGCIGAEIQDATVYRPEWEQGFDCVIADVPCSGYGVMNRKPEIRYKDPKLLESLPPLQAKILAQAGRYLRPGGVLLYATCTLRPAENEDIVTGFLANREDYALEAFTLPEPIGRAESGQLTLWPQRSGTDGFFIAKLRRRE